MARVGVEKTLTVYTVRLLVQAHPVSHLTQQMSQLRQAGNTGGASPLPPTGTPCCAPTKMAPLSLVYYDTAGRIVFGDLPDMKTERCGCA